jgi:alpha-D-xyloside xylohydrolase
MKKKISIAFIIAINLFVTGAYGQSYQKTNYGVQFATDSLNVELSFYDPSTMRIVKSPLGKTFTKESLSVIKNPKKISFSIKQAGNILSLTTEKFTASISLRSGTIMCYSGKNILLREKESATKFTSFNDAGTNTFSVFQSFILDKDEAIYGLGQQQGGKMVQRNLRLNMVQNNTHDYVPFFQSVKGYGIFWDNYSPTQFVDNTEGTSFKSDVGDCIDYYFMYGGNADGVIA